MKKKARIRTILLRMRMTTVLTSQSLNCFYTEIEKAIFLFLGAKNGKDKYRVYGISMLENLTDVVMTLTSVYMLASFVNSVDLLFSMFEQYFEMQYLVHTFRQEPVTCVVNPFLFQNITLANLWENVLCCNEILLHASQYEMGN